MTDSANTVEPGEATPVCVEPAPAQNSEPRRCGARLRGKGGKTCQQFAIAGRSRCRIHGGSSPRGTEHPSFTTGAYSRALPRSFRKDFLRYVNDPELISSRTELGVLRCRLATLAGRLESGESADAWGRLRDQLAKAKAACEAHDIDAVRAAVGKAGEITDGANESETAFDAYCVLAERFTVIAARESRRMLEAGFYLNVEQVRAIGAALAAAVARHADTRTRALIGEEFQRLRLGNFDELAGAVGTVPTPTTVNTSDAGEGTNDERT